MNSLNTPSQKRKLSSRFVLYVGFKCNLRCQFCYYLKSLETGNAKNEPLEDLKKKMAFAKRLGKTDIDFTGGEPTIHPHFFELISYAKELGFQTINVITNGQVLADLQIFKQFAEAGLNEVLFSLHSYHAVEHDRITQKKGSFERALRAIENAKSLGLRVRLNSVVHAQNYNDLDSLLSFFKTLTPNSVNLIVFNPTEETLDHSSHDKVRLDSYLPIAEALKIATEKYQNHFPFFNIRFLPFCYLKNHEDVIRTYWQEIYEKEEWDPLLHWLFRKNIFFVSVAILLGFLSSFLNPMIRIGKKDFWTQMAEYLQHIRVLYLFRHKKECRLCALRNICPGLPRDFYSKHKNAQVFPYLTTPTILNPIFFGTRYPEKFEALKEK